MSEAVTNRQISPTDKTRSGKINLDFPFSIAESVLNHDERKLTPIWPPVTDMFFSEMKMNSFFHNHRHFELIYVLEGTFTQHLENSIYVLNAGDATLLNSRIRHFEGEETECRCLYLNFSPDFLNSLFQENMAAPGKQQHSCTQIMEFCIAETDPNSISRAAIDFRKSISSVSGKSPNIETILDTILTLLREEPSGYAFFLQGYLLQLFECFENKLLYHISHIETLSDTASVLFADINHYLSESNGRISKQELSKLLHYNSDYLGRIIRKETGMSFSEYSKSIWLSKAKEILRSTDMSIHKIISFLGYESGNSFYRAFQEDTGMTPGEYRKKYR